MPTLDDTFPTLREYLDQSGLLANGTEDEIAAARMAYRKGYKTRHKRLQRKEGREVGVLLARSHEYARIETAAKKHRLSVPSFLKAATFAYLEKTYIVPDHNLIYRLANILQDCLNEIRELTQVKATHSFFIEQQYELIEKRIVELEGKINQVFSMPVELEKAITEAISKNPELRSRLLALLSPQPDALHL